MLLLAVVLASKDAAPTATFWAPVVFWSRALKPIPVLLSAVVFAVSRVAGIVPGNIFNIDFNILIYLYLFN